MPITIYLCMAESSVLFVTMEGVMQVSSVCWVGVRIAPVSPGLRTTAQVPRSCLC